MWVQVLYSTGVVLFYNIELKMSISYTKDNHLSVIYQTAIKECVIFLASSNI